MSYRDIVPKNPRETVVVSPGEFYPDEETLTEDGSDDVLEPLPGLRGLLRVQRMRRRSARPTASTST